MDAPGQQDCSHYRLILAAKQTFDTRIASQHSQDYCRGKSTFVFGRPVLYHVSDPLLVGPARWLLYAHADVGIDPKSLPQKFKSSQQRAERLMFEFILEHFVNICQLKEIYDVRSSTQEYVTALPSVRAC